jgi:hypothetical protein
MGVHHLFIRLPNQILRPIFDFPLAAHRPKLTNSLVMNKYIHQTRSKHNHDAEQTSIQHITSVNSELSRHIRQMGRQKPGVVRCSSGIENQGHRRHVCIKRREFRRFGPSVCRDIGWIAI